MEKNKYKYKLKEQKNTIKPSELSSPLLKKIAAAYGKIDMENDFFSPDLATYYKTDEYNKDTGGVSHKIIRLANFGAPIPALNKAVKALEILYKTPEGKIDLNFQELANNVASTVKKYKSHIRKEYPEQYKDVLISVDEASMTGTGSSFSPGTGEQYATPYAFNPNKNASGTSKNYYYKLGFKKVPKKIPNSGLEVKKLFEQDDETPAESFQKQRIEAFSKIEDKLNDTYKLISNARNKTIDYYATNPSSLATVISTDLIIDYLNDISTLLKED